MQTVGNDLFRLTPVTALIVVLSQSLVLFLFASRGLEQWLLQHGLPTIPLVPLSSSQAVIGAVLGLAIAKGARGIRYKVVGRIGLAWLVAPVIAGVISFIALFFAQNLFEMEVIGQDADHSKPALQTAGVSTWQNSSKTYISNVEEKEAPVTPTVSTITGEHRVNFRVYIS